MCKLHIPGPHPRKQHYVKYLLPTPTHPLPLSFFLPPFIPVTGQAMLPPLGHRTCHSLGLKLSSLRYSLLIHIGLLSKGSFPWSPNLNNCPLLSFSVLTALFSLRHCLPSDTVQIYFLSPRSFQNGTSMRVGMLILCSIPQCLEEYLACNGFSTAICWRNALIQNVIWVFLYVILEVRYTKFMQE